MDNEVVGIAQIADGLLSDTLDRIMMLPSDLAPRTPHQYLVRAEVENNTVRVYGPEPAFGNEYELTFASTASTYAYAASGALHAEPTAGLELEGVLGEAVVVFTSGPDPLEPTSAPGVTYPTAFDPPILKSALGPDHSVCLAGLAGTVGSTADLDW